MSLDVNALPPTTSADFAGYDKNEGGSKYFARLKIYTATAGAIATGLMQAGKFGAETRKDSIVSLGDRVTIIPLAYKVMALDTSVPGKPVRSFDGQSETFKAIQRKADGGSNSNCQYGTLFLVYEASQGKPLEFFCSPPSWREDVTDKLKPYLGMSQADIDRMKAANVDVTGKTPKAPTACTLVSKLVERPGRKWHVPVVNDCTTQVVNMPTSEQVCDWVTRFFAPPADAQGEKVAEASTRAH